MRKFLTVMFVLLMVVASTQTFRHVYVKWIEPTGSVLDQFQSETESEIAQSRTLDELLPLYADAKSRVEEYEADSSNPPIERYERAVTEPYKTEAELRQEIEQRENQQRQVFQLYFYWLAGLASIFGGVLVYRKVNVWIGIAAVVTGFLEMVFWTSPLNHYHPGQEFGLLLNSKLGLSVATLAVLVSLWLTTSRKLDGNIKNGDT